MKTFELGIKNRSIKVVKVCNNDIENLIQFEETWYDSGDVLQEVNDINKDISLYQKLDDRTFTYRGSAKVGESYYKVANQVI